MLRCTLPIACLLLLVACGGGPDNATPEAAIKASVAALQKSDLQAFTKAAIPPADRAEAERSWNEQRSLPVDPAEEAQFDMMLTQLTADGAEETLMKLIRPQLAEAQQGLQMGVGMLTMMVAGALHNEDLSPDEQQESQQMMTSLSQWLSSIDLTDEAKTKRAVAIACASARELGIRNRAQLMAMDFDAMLVTAGRALGGVKQILAEYGLDVDQTLRSVQIGSAVIDGDTARVPVSLQLLGETRSSVSVLKRIEGRWYSHSETPAD